MATTKLGGYKFYNDVLGRPKLVVAPMVDQSELAWRLLSRRHGSQLCYTPMLHASVFIRDKHYRNEALASCVEDRPLIVQFCANDPDIFVKAGLLAQSSCDAIDLNLGCPQSIAKRGHYGAFLQDEWELISKMVQHAHEKLSVPITCKIRLFPELEKTVRYAQMLEKAGCQVLTVHGRTRDMKGRLTGLANWDAIKAIKESVSIPVFANGNIQYLSDVEKCIEHTGVDGVMTAEGNLHNPAIFEGKSPPIWEMSKEYLDIVEQYQCPLSYVRGHLFKMWLHSLEVHCDLRVELAKAKTISEVINVCDKLETRAKADMEKGLAPINKKLKHPHWICQPYVRPTPEETEQNKREKSLKRPLLEESNSQGLSKNKQKRRDRSLNKAKCQNKGVHYEKCVTCGNPRGLRCVFLLCRTCCKHAAFTVMKDCPGHNLMPKIKLARRLKWEAEQAKNGYAATATKNCTPELESKGHGDSNNLDNQNVSAALNVTSRLSSSSSTQAENIGTDSENPIDHHGNGINSVEQRNLDNGCQGNTVSLKKDECMESCDKGSDDDHKMDHDGRENCAATVESNVT